MQGIHQEPVIDTAVIHDHLLIALKDRSHWYAIPSDMALHLQISDQFLKELEHVDVMTNMLNRFQQAFQESLIRKNVEPLDEVLKCYTLNIEEKKIVTGFVRMRICIVGHQI